MLVSNVHLFALPVLRPELHWLLSVVSQAAQPFETHHCACVALVGEGAEASHNNDYVTVPGGSVREGL